VRHVPDFSADSLVTFIENNVESGSQVHTEGRQRYVPLPVKGYRHRVTVVGKDSTQGSRVLPAVHRVVSLLKRWLIGTHHGRVEAKHLRS